MSGGRAWARKAVSQEIKVAVERRLGQEVEPGRQEDQLLGALGPGHALLDHAKTLPQAQAVAGAAGPRGRELKSPGYTRPSSDRPR